MDPRHRFYIHMAFDEYISDIGNDDVATLNEFKSLVNNEDFYKICDDVFGKIEDRTKEFLKKTFEASVRWDINMEIIIPLDTPRIFLSGFTKHAICLVLRRHADGVEVAAINTGSGCEYHGIELKSGTLLTNAIVVFNVDNKNINFLLSLISLAYLKSDHIDYKSDPVSFYEIFISKMFELSVESKTKKFHELGAIQLPAQQGGSCTYHSILYSIFWLLMISGTSKDPNKFVRLKYMLSKYAITKVMPGIDLRNNIDNMTIKEMSIYKKNFLREKHNISMDTKDTVSNNSKKYYPMMTY